MMWRIPRWNNQWRWGAILYGIVSFIWLGLEDNDAIGAAILGVSLSTLFTFAFLSNRFGGATIPLKVAFPSAIAAGALVGGGSALATALWMFFKNARHTHIYPDFPLTMIADVLALGPTWAIVGAMIALGVLMIWVGLRRF